MITKKDLVSLLPSVFATYFAREMGFVDVRKLICPLDLVTFSGGIIVLFMKGNPLLERFNIIMRHYLKAGFQEKVWTELQNRAALRGAKNFTGAAGDRYFTFSLSHLKPAFVVLLVGTVLSSVVFIVELIVNCLCKRRRKCFRSL
jgi:hypothetical protein